MKSRQPVHDTVHDSDVSSGGPAQGGLGGLFGNSAMGGFLGLGGLPFQNNIMLNPTWDWTDAWPRDREVTETWGDPMKGGLRVRGTPEGGFYGDGTIWGAQSKDRIGGADVNTSLRFGTLENRAGLYRDDDGNTRVGHHHQYSLFKDQIEATWQGGGASLEANGPNVSFDANVGTDGLSLGAQATLADVAGTVHNIGSGSQDQLARLGISEGVGAAGRLHWGDKDRDGYREYGFGADIGPVSFDLKSEDPLRDIFGAATGGFGPMAMDLLGLDLKDSRGNSNWTHAVGEGISSAAGTAWDGITGLAGDAWDWASGIDPSTLGGPLMAPLGGLGDAWDTVSDWASGIDPSVIGGPLTAPLGGLGEAASSAWDTASEWAGSIDPSVIGGPLMAPVGGLVDGIGSLFD